MALTFCFPRGPARPKRWIRQSRLIRASRWRMRHAIRAEVAKAKMAIGTAAECVARSGTERERSHVEVLSLAINGQSATALTLALEHLDRWPRDVLIFSLPLGAFGLFAFSGMANHDQARVDLCERHARHFSRDDWWFLTYRGWAHGENGDVATGRSLTQRALVACGSRRAGEWRQRPSDHDLRKQCCTLRELRSADERRK